MVDDSTATAFEMAMSQFLDMHRRRVVAMFNRDRARFAEMLVAVLLGEGAEVADNPNHAWDVTFNRSRTAKPMRLQVKCSGAYLPSRVAFNPDYRAPAVWELPCDSVGIDANFIKLPKGRHWDYLILARHEGDEIGMGWYFWVLPSRLVPGLARAKMFTEAKIDALGATSCTPDQLRATLLKLSRH
jgi:hypothetical protein